VKQCDITKKCNTVLGMKIWIYCSEYISWIIKTENFTDAKKFYWSWTGGPVDKPINFNWYFLTVFLRSPSWFGWPFWNTCVTNNHGYVPLVVNTSRSFPRLWIITGFVTRWTRRVSLMEQELLTLPEHLSFPRLD